MKVKVLYFAAARDMAATQSESLVLHDGASLGDLSAEVLRLHPALKKILSSVRFSVNLVLSDHARTLRDADEVGVLPPVAGG